MSAAEFRLRQLTIELGRTLSDPGYEYVLLEDAIEAMKEGRAEALRGAAEQIEKLPLYDGQAVTKADAAESMRNRALLVVAAAPDPQEGSA